MSSENGHELTIALKFRFGRLEQSEDCRTRLELPRCGHRMRLGSWLWLINEFHEVKILNFSERSVRLMLLHPRLIIAQEIFGAFQLMIPVDPTYLFQSDIRSLLHRVDKDFEYQWFLIAPTIHCCHRPQ
jgi:hypothetical protein